MISKLNSNLLITATFGTVFALLHFIQKQDEKYAYQIESIQRKLKIISNECERMKNQLEKIECDLGNLHHIASSSLHSDGDADFNVCKDADDCCVEYVENIEDYDHDVSISTRTRSRSHSLSSVLGSAKKLVFG